MTSEAPTITEALRDSTSRFRQAGIESPDLDARLLLKDAGRFSRNELISRQNARLTPDVLAKFEAYVERRIEHEPVHRILGKREFYGREFLLSKDTLVPRPDTETVIDVALQEIGDRSAELSILDLGTGSGVIAVTLACELDNASLVAVDISSEALVTAKQNAIDLGVGERIRFLQGDLFQPVDEGFDLIVSNPPYIRSDDLGGLQAEVRLHDPELALDGGKDGLKFYKQIFEGGSRLLRDSGVICVEIGQDQGNVVFSIASDFGYAACRIWDDIGGRNRVVTARRGL